MNKLIRYIFVLVSIVILASCSNVKVGQDYIPGYDFSALKTFAWKPNENNEYGIKGNDIVDERIRTAIENQLAAKSYELVTSSDPDFFVSYNIKIEKKISNSGASGSITLGRSSYGRYGGVGMSTGSQVRTYEQGDLFIDFTDPLEDKLIWQGVSAQVIDRDSSPDKSRVIINETVEKMLSQFPPEK